MKLKTTLLGVQQVHDEYSRVYHKFKFTGIMEITKLDKETNKVIHVKEQNVTLEDVILDAVKPNTSVEFDIFHKIHNVLPCKICDSMLFIHRETNKLECTKCSTIKII